MGIDKNTVECLQPITKVRNPNKMEPKMTPTAPMDPIHEISEVVNGPLNNGVLSETNLGIEGATLKQIYNSQCIKIQFNYFIQRLFTQPNMQPCPSVIKLPVFTKITRFFFV